MLSWFWCFIIYSFAGCLMETVFCLLFNFSLESRKCMLLCALCPVYGLGGIAVASFAEPFKSSKIITFIIGMITASLIEYIFDMYYKELLGVSFWDYSNRFLNINGRVWIVYSVIWGILSLAIVYKFHPIVKNFSEKIPLQISLTMVLFFIADTIFSNYFMYRFSTKNAVNLAWLFKQLNS